MEKNLLVSTWNIHGALSDPSRINKVLGKIDDSDADIITLPDAWHEDSEESIPTERKLLVTAGEFRRRGFTALKATFREDRPDDNFARYGFITLIRDTIVPTYETLSLGDRPAHHLRLEMGSTAVNLISLYLNDQSDMQRLYQVHELFKYLSHFERDAAVVMGDMNAMHRSSMATLLLGNRLARSILGKINFANDTLPRLTQMASGKVMDEFERQGFEDADLDRYPTMPTRLPLFQLDHILVRGGDTVSIEADSLYHDWNWGLSDHLMISSLLTFTQK